MSTSSFPPPRRKEPSSPYRTAALVGGDGPRIITPRAPLEPLPERRPRPMPDVPLFRDVRLGIVQAGIGLVMTAIVLWALAQVHELGGRAPRAMLGLLTICAAGCVVVLLALTLRAVWRFRFARLPDA